MRRSDSHDIPCACEERMRRSVSHDMPCTCEERMRRNDSHDIPCACEGHMKIPKTLFSEDCCIETAALLSDVNFIICN